MSNIRGVFRSVKNTMMQYSEIECKVRESTSNDSWGASTSLMSEIARATNDYQEYPKLFAMLWKRLNDYEHVMHVQKALILIDYLLRNGNDRFINDCKRRARDIAALKKYKHYDANNQDDAKEARAKAKAVYDLLMDDQKLAEARAKASQIKDVRLSGFGSEGGFTNGGGADGPPQHRQAYDDNDTDTQARQQQAQASSRQTTQQQQPHRRTESGDDDPFGNQDGDNTQQQTEKKEKKEKRGRGKEKEI